MIPVVTGDAAQVKRAVEQAMRRRLEVLGRLEANVNIEAGGARGASQNALIANVQAEHGRDPWYIDQDTKDAVRILVRRLGATPERIDAALRKIGHLCLDAILGNVAQQANRGGRPFRALSAAYAAYKQRKFGFTVPILKATNDLLGGLRVRVERKP